MNEVTVHGLRELREALVRKIPDHYSEKVLQKALAAGNRPVVKDAKARAPDKTGTLRRAIFSARDKASSNGVYEQRVVGVRSGKRFAKSRKDAFYWRFIEFGRGVVTAAKGTLGTPEHGFFGKTVKAYKPRPFLRPAFQAMKFIALEAIRKSLADEIPKAARKARWRTPSSRS